MASRTPPSLAPTFLSTHPTLSMPEAATQTYKQGAFLAVTAGLIGELATNGTIIAGIAMQPGSNLTTANTPQGAFDGQAKVLPAFSGVPFEITLDKATALGAYTSLITDVGAAYGVTRDANGIWYIDVDKSGGLARVIIVGFRDPIGTVGARVYAVVRTVNQLIGV